MRIKITKPILALVVVAASVLGGISAYAQNNQQGGSAIQISPTRTEMTLDKTETKDFTVTVRNITSGPLVAKVYLHDFESDNETGEPRIVTDPNKTSAYSLKKFITNLNDVELAKGESKNVKFTVAVPPDAVPGGYYGILRFAAVPKSQSTDNNQPQVGLTASVAHLVLVGVPGDVNAGLKIDGIWAERDGNRDRLFFQPPNKAAVRITNTGSGFLKPFGKVIITKGNKEVYSYEINKTSPPSNILPKSSRTFKDEIKNIGSFGRFTITAHISYAEGGEVVSLSKSFWVIPTWLLVVILVLVIALVFTLYKLFERSRRRSRRKKHIR